jgi:hypothetical protein
VKICSEVYLTGSVTGYGPCLLNSPPSPHIPLHSTTLFTSFFFFFSKKKHIKSFTFYITSFTLYYYSNKKITTKQNFSTFLYHFFICPYQSVLLLFFNGEQCHVMGGWGMCCSLPNDLMMSVIMLRAFDICMVLFHILRMS